MKNIIVDPCDCWEYFLEHKKELINEEHIIAENKEEYGIEICMGMQLEMPLFTVYLDDTVIHTDYVSFEEQAEVECEEIVTELYDKYLDDIEHTLKKMLLEDDEVEDAPVEDDYDTMINKDAISCQESQIDEAVELFLETICDGFLHKLFTPNEFEDIKDHFCEYIARKYKKDVYRPMYLERQDGTEFFTEFPYEDMIFDDPDNPIYK